MTSGEVFERYLQRIDGELLEAVARDCVWLAWEFRDAPAAAGYVARREACREECARRGCPQMYRSAEQILTGEAA